VEGFACLGSVVERVGSAGGKSEKAGRVRGRWFRRCRVGMKGSGRGRGGTVSEKGGTASGT